MKIQDFELLSDLEKEEAIWKNGTFKLNYNIGNNLCDVYGLFTFFVYFCYELDKNLKAKISTSLFPYSRQVIGSFNWN